MKTNPCKPLSCYLLLVLLFAPGIRAEAQTHEHPNLPVSETEAFLEEVREATRRFQDRDEAMAAGYRLIGPDFPGMGEHWVLPRQILARTIDPSMPSVLSYLTISEQPTLTGVAFAVPVREGEDLPPPPIAVDWHTHEGTVAEETLVLNPRVSMRGGESGYRLAMFHAWVWLDNPAGIFEQDNWALPYHRAGIAVPERTSAAAGKALFLVTGGVEYYETLLHKAGDPTEAEAGAIRRVLLEHALRVESLRAVDFPTEELESIWDSLWEDLKELSSEPMWESIEMLRD